MLSASSTKALECTMSFTLHSGSSWRSRHRGRQSNTKRPWQPSQRWVDPAPLPRLQQHRPRRGPCRPREHLNPPEARPHTRGVSRVTVLPCPNRRSCPDTCNSWRNGHRHGASPRPVHPSTRAPSALGAGALAMGIAVATVRISPPSIFMVLFLCALSLLGFAYGIGRPKE